MLLVKIVLGGISLLAVVALFGAIGLKGPVTRDDEDLDD